MFNMPILYTGSYTKHAMILAQSPPMAPHVSSWNFFDFTPELKFTWKEKH
jgi:hypothetical protein